MLGSENNKLPIDLLGRYQNSSVLGQGGMGIVFVAEDTVLSKKVVIKTLPSGADNNAIIRFQKEAKAAAKLQHSNIVSAIDFGVSKDDNPYLIMEFVDGKTLSECLELGPMDLAATIKMMIHVTNGLNHAQSKGVLHRDIKPSNIMLDYSKGKTNFKALIIDFGIASLRKADAVGYESTGSGIVGSPAYMAPEISKGEKATIESEIYSLGCVLFECLAGKQLFTGDSPLEVTRQHVEAAPPNLNELIDLNTSEQINLGLTTVVSKCLAKNPNDRYHSFHELNIELESLIQELNTILPDDEKLSPEIQNSSVNKIQPKTIFAGVAGFLGLSILIGLITSQKFQQISDSSNSEARTNKIRFLLDDKKKVSTLNMVDRVLVGSVSTLTDEDLIKGRISNSKTNTLKLTSKSVTDRGVESLSGKEIHKIDLSFSSITKQSLDTLKEIVNLQELSLNGVDELDDSWLIELGKMTNLIRLRIDGANVTNGGLKHLTGLKNLQMLSVSGCSNLTDQGLNYLINLPKMSYLSVSNTKVSGQTMAKFTNLGSLHARYCKLDNEDIKYIASLKRLRFLRLDGNQFTDIGLMMLAGLPDLKRIEISNCSQITKGGIAKFIGTKKDCEVVHFDDSAI